MIVVREGRNLRLVGALRFKNRMGALPGRAGWKDDQFFCEPSRANIEWIASEFPAAEWKCDDLQQIRVLEEVESDMLEAVDGDIADHTFKTQPLHKAQLKAWLKSRNAEAFAYFMEMGTGKTWVAINKIAWQWHNSMIDAVILIAPNGVHRQFINEQVPAHMPLDVSYEGFVYQSGGNAEYNRKKAKFVNSSTPNKLKILAINVDSFSHKSGMDYVQSFMRKIGGVGKKKILIIVDESTRIKNIGSKRTKNIIKVGSFCQYRLILSGSPVTRGVEDLFAQFLFLGPNLLGFTSFYTFRNRYCQTKKGGKPGSEYDIIVGYQNIDELKRKMKPWSFRVKKEECLDLPPKIYVTREVPLGTEQKKIYTQLRREMEVEFDNSQMSVPMAAVRITKLQQILCGHIQFTEEGKLSIIEDVPRFDIVRDLVEEAQGKVVIWARFTADIDRLVQVLQPFGVSRYDGKVKNDQRIIEVNEFLRGDRQVMVAQPAAAAVGHNWIGPTTVIYFSNSFDAEHRWQSEDRCHRQGILEKVTYIDLVVPNSIDTHILKVLKNKGDVASLTIDDYRELLKLDPGEV